MSIVDLARQRVVMDSMAVGAVAESMPIWIARLRELVGDPPSPDSVLALGDHLSETFALTKGLSGERGQSQVARGGVAWEGLVCFYLNLALIGSNTIVFKKRRQVPAPLQSALTVTYQNVRANTESDMVAVSFPDGVQSIRDPLLRGESALDRLSVAAAKYFNELSVAVVQCKTNWNENAQIPMLWDMLYHADHFDRRRIVVGTDNYALTNLKSFAYSFVTVPTNKLEGFNPNSLAVRRTQQISGGNYWGRPGRQGVAGSLREIFRGANIGPGGGRNVRESLTAALPRLRNDYAYFGF